MKKTKKLKKNSRYVIRSMMGQYIKVYIDKDRNYYNLVAVYQLNNGTHATCAQRIFDFSKVEEIALRLCEYVLVCSLNSIQDKNLQELLKSEIIRDPTKSAPLPIPALH